MIECIFIQSVEIDGLCSKCIYRRIENKHFCSNKCPVNRGVNGYYAYNMVVEKTE